MSEEEAEASKPKTVKFFLVMWSAPRIVGLPIAIGIYFMKKDLYEARMVKLVAAIDGIGWLVAAGCVFTFLVFLSNTIPMIWKNAVFPGNAGNLRANMIVYKVQPKPTEYVMQKAANGGWDTVEAKQAPYVMMENDGNIGAYNRANRALNHFVENGMTVLVAFMLSGLVFSEAAFCLMLAYMSFRVWYQIAYSIGGYGIGFCKHLLPFALHTGLVACIFEILLWLAAIRMIIIQYTDAAAF